MLLLVIGLLVFVGIHLLPTQTDIRRVVIERAGIGVYKAFFSIVAVIGFAIIVMGYHKAQLHPGKNPVLWTSPAWARHITMLLMIFAFPLLFAAYLPGRISAAVRHPMILAVKLWALAHLIVRGDVASLLLFGGLLAWAVVDRISLKHRQAAGLVTIKSGPVRNDIIAIVLGLLAYAIFVKWGHPALIGVAIIP